jgi:hypothetical protein
MSCKCCSGDKSAAGGRQGGDTFAPVLAASAGRLHFNAAQAGEASFGGYRPRLPPSVVSVAGVCVRLIS